MSVIEWKENGVWKSIATIKGDKGDTGEKGETGVGVPTGGTTGQILKKKTNTNYDTEWGNLDLSNYSLVTETGNKIDLSIDTSTYVMTLVLKDKNNNALSTGTIDLPLETMVVGATYDNVNRKIVLTLKNGQTIDVPVGDLVNGLVSETTYNQGMATKENLFRYSNMPTASASNVGQIVEYVGETDTFTKGYFYECTDTSVQESITATQTDNVVPLGTITLNTATLKSQLSAGTYEFVYRPYDTVLNFSNISVFPPVMIQVTRDNTFDRQPMIPNAPKIYSWVDGSNNFYVTDTLQPNALTKLYLLDVRTNETTDTGATFISSNTPSQLEGRWTKKEGDVYTDVEISDYGILLSSAGLPGNTIQVNYVAANTSYSWVQKNVQPSSGSSNLNIENGTGTNSLQQKNVTASGDISFATGEGTIANGKWSHIEGRGNNFEVTGISITTTEGISKIIVNGEKQADIRKNAVIWCNGYYYVTAYATSGSNVEITLDREVTNFVANTTIKVFMGASLASASHVEGNFNNTVNLDSETLLNEDDVYRNHAEGSRTLSAGYCSHSEGEYTVALGNMSYACGNKTKALGNHSFASGYETTAQASNSSAFGRSTIAYGISSFAEGNGNKAKAENSHAEGQGNTIETNATNSHAEGYNNEVRSSNSHAEGQNNKIQNDSVFCHAEGDNNLIKYSSEGCHAEGKDNIIEVTNKYVHIGGNNNKIERNSVNCDFVHGGNLVARNNNGYQTIFGQHNDRGIKVVKRFKVDSNRISGRLIVKIGNAFEAVYPEQNMIVYSPKLVNLTTGLKITEDMTTTQTSKEVKKWRRTGSCSASSSNPEGCYGIKNFATAWSIIDYIDDIPISAGIYELSFYVLYGTLPFAGDFDMFVSHNGVTLTGSDYTYTNYDENGLFEVGFGDGTYNRKNALRVNALGQVVAGSAALSSTDDSATLVPRQYLDDYYYNSSEIDTNFVNKNAIKTSLASGNDNVYSTTYINAQFNGVEPRGRISIGGTMYEVIISTTDAGTAGKITFVLEE